MKAIECFGISKRYGDFESLSDVTLSVETGTVTALLGHNGSGKTTLLKILAGVLTPTEGSVSLFGQQVDPHSVGSDVAYLPQDIELFGNLTVKENIDYFLRVNRSALDFEDFIEFLGLRDYTGVRYSRLSGGLKRRTAIACALAGSPRVLLLDEPTAGLDAASRGEFWKLILELKRRGMTVIVTVHEMSDARAYSDSMILLRHGRVSDEDPGHPLRIRIRGCPPGFTVDGFDVTSEGDVAVIRSRSIRDLQSLLEALSAMGVAEERISVDSDEEEML